MTALLLITNRASSQVLLVALVNIMPHCSKGLKKHYDSSNLATKDPNGVLKQECEDN